MAAVILFIVVVKEGGWDKLTEVLLIVLIGGETHLNTSDNPLNGTLTEFPLPFCSVYK